MTVKDIIDKIRDNGWSDDVIILDNYDFADAFVGMSDEGRAVYDYDKMVHWLMDEEEFSEIEAVDWIDYNVLRALPYMGNKTPVILYNLED